MVQLFRRWVRRERPKQGQETAPAARLAAPAVPPTGIHAPLIVDGPDKNCANAAEIRAEWRAQVERNTSERTNRGAPSFVLPQRETRRDRLARLYREGYRISDIADVMGYANENSVQSSLRYYGVPRTRRSGRKPIGWRTA